MIPGKNFSLSMTNKVAHNVRIEHKTIAEKIAEEYKKNKKVFITAVKNATSPKKEKKAKTLNNPELIKMVFKESTRELKRSV